MKTKHLFMAVAILVVTSWWSLGGAVAQEGKDALLQRLSKDITDNTVIDQRVRELAQTKLLEIIVNPVLVSEIKAQNAKNVPLETIKKIDEEWKAKEGDVPLLEELKSNATAKELEKTIKSIPQIAECFVMDNQGANVGQYNDTSDYWQGDEPKWTNAFNGGKGGIDVGKKEIDQSTSLAQQQISLPVIDGDGTVVGAITFGVTME